MDNITLTPSDFVVGSFDSSGADYYRTDRIRASNISITTTSLNVNITPNINKTLQFAIASFDANGNLVDYIGTWQDNGNTVQLSNTAVKIKIAIRTTDNIDMQPNYITSCSIVTRGWIMQNGELTNTDFLSLPDEPFHGDSPYTFWRIDPNANEGMPYVGLMIGVPALAPEPPPVPVEPVPQKEYITVHDMRTLQNNFDNHGICVLDPTQCKVTEQLNGEYSAYLEHPMDDWGKWKYLLEMNFLKIMGQLFVIYKVNHSINGTGEGTVKVWARHIFYLLNDRWIYSGVGYISTSPQILLQGMYMQAKSEARDTDIIYAFTATSDLPTMSTDVSRTWQQLNSGLTFGEFVLGAGGFIDVLGGELHRDNFAFSVNQRKQYTKDNAFEIRVGLNMRSITREIDTSQTCTFLKGYDTFGNSYAVSTVGSAQTYPHHIVREVVFNYDEPDFERLKSDTNEQFDLNKYPKTVYTVNVKDLRNNSEFAEIGIPEFKVGDKGWIIDDRLERIIGSDRVELKITKTVTDGITGEVIEVTFGDKTSITRPAQKKTRALTREQIDQLVNETQAAARTLGTWNAVYNYTWGELQRFTWNQVNGSPT